MNIVFLLLIGKNNDTWKKHRLEKEATGYHPVAGFILPFSWFEPLKSGGKKHNHLPSALVVGSQGK